MNEEELKAALEAAQTQLAEKDSMLSEARSESASRRQTLKTFEGVDLEEYKTLKEAAAGAEQTKLESQGNFEAAKQAIMDANELALNDLKSQNNKLKTKLQSVTISDAVKSTAMALGAINPKNVALVLREEIVMNDEGSVEILGDDGKTIFTAEGKPLTVEDRVKTFLEANPYMVKGGTSGSGSTGGEHKSESSAPTTALERIQRGLAANKK